MQNLIKLDFWLRGHHWRSLQDAFFLFVFKKVCMSSASHEYKNKMASWGAHLVHIKQHWWLLRKFDNSSNVTNYDPSLFNKTTCMCVLQLL